MLVVYINKMKTGAEAAKEGIKRRFGSKQKGAATSTGREWEVTHRPVGRLRTAVAPENGPEAQNIADDSAGDNTGVHGRSRRPAHPEQAKLLRFLYKCRNL